MNKTFLKYAVILYILFFLSACQKEPATSVNSYNSFDNNPMEMNMLGDTTRIQPGEYLYVQINDQMESLSKGEIREMVDKGIEIAGDHIDKSQDYGIIDLPNLRNDELNDRINKLFRGQDIKIETDINEGVWKSDKAIIEIELRTTPNVEVAATSIEGEIDNETIEALMSYTVKVKVTIVRYSWPIVDYLFGTSSASNTQVKAGVGILGLSPFLKKEKYYTL